MSTVDTRIETRRDTPDAVGRGSMGAGGDGSSTLFVLAGSSLGATLIEGEGAPQWFDLRQVVALDALGEPEGSKIRVEVAFDSGEHFEALWPEPFCEKVVARLEELLDTGAMSREAMADREAGVESTHGAPSSPTGSSAQTFAIATPFGAPSAEGVGADAATDNEADTLPLAEEGLSEQAPEPIAEDVSFEVDLTLSGGEVGMSPPVGFDAPEELPPPPVVGGDLPLPGDGPPLASTPTESGEHELVLRDVIYHGGFPGEPKRRKKCTLVLGGSGIEISGPAGPQVHLEWERVRSIEAQNADEAKFRLNLRTKRGSTTLVIECDDESTVLVEARDVSTLPLRAAVAEMVSGRGVVVA